MSSFMKRGLGSLVCMLATSIVVSGGCSATPKGSLMLSISTDMQTPKDLDVVSLFVATDGVAKFDYLGRVLPDGTLSLPSTLALVQPENPNAQVHIRVTGFQTQGTQENARVLRDVLTTVPTERTALLRLPLDFIDDGSGHGTLPAQYVPLGASGAPEGLTQFDPTTTIASKCDPMKLCETPGSNCQTTINGSCASATVNSSALPTYSDSEVFGDGGTEASPVCFDVEMCFQGATRVASVDTANCTFPLAAGTTPTKLNLALATTSTGALVNGQYLVPLANDPTDGWSASGTTVTMPAAICGLLTNGAQLYEATSGACPPMTDTMPVCEPTAADAGEGATFDAGIQPLPDGGTQPLPDGGCPAASLVGTGMACPPQTQVTLATKVTLNVTWPGTLSTQSPDAGTTPQLSLWLLSNYDVNGTTITGATYTCGDQTPPYLLTAVGDMAQGEPTGVTGEVQITFLPKVWDAIMLYMNNGNGTAATGTIGGWNIGSSFQINPITSVLGLAPTSTYAQASTTWPTNETSIPSTDYSDDDHDGFPGITATPVGTSATSTPYALPVTSLSQGPPAQALFVVTRTEISLCGESTSCTEGEGTATVALLNSHVIGCELLGYDQDAGPDADTNQLCDDGTPNGAQTQFLDTDMTQYTVLSGTYRTVQISSEAGVTPTCDDVRSLLP
jgi:hypothetical protein